MTVNTPSRDFPFCQNLDSARGKLARALLGGNPTSIAKAALAIAGVREATTVQMLVNINKECSKLCRKKKPVSLYRKIPVRMLSEFKWSDMITELEQTAPLLLQIFRCIVAHNDKRNKSKVGIGHYPGICMAMSLLLKERCREICGLQSVVSLFMYSNQCNKQV